MKQMNSLTDIKEVRAALESCGIRPSKGMGQNFLINPSVCPRMAKESGIDEHTGVLEIGPGIGVLTCELAKLAQKVVSIELDTRLEPVLAANLAPYPNAEVVWGDVMKLDLPNLIAERFADCERVAVCANLPYYITSPIVMLLLESRLPIESITVMVQKEAADRMCAPVGSRESGAVTVAVSYYAEPEILFGVSAGSFMPAPKVDSAVMRLSIRKAPEFDVGDEKIFRALVRAGFSQRRKTLVNSASTSPLFGKAKLTEALSRLGINPAVRAEKLSMEQLAALSRILSE